MLGGNEGAKGKMLQARICTRVAAATKVPPSWAPANPGAACRSAGAHQLGASYAYLPNVAFGAF